MIFSLCSLPCTTKIQIRTSENNNNNNVIFELFKFKVEGTNLINGYSVEPDFKLEATQKQSMLIIQAIKCIIQELIDVGDGELE